MKKLLFILIIFSLIVGIPLTIYLSQQQQDIRQRAGPISVINPANECPNGAVCGEINCSVARVKITIRQTFPEPLHSFPDGGRCPDLATIHNNNIVPLSGNPTHAFDHISYDITVESMDGKDHNAEIAMSAGYCKEPYGTFSSNTIGDKYFVCNQNEKSLLPSGAHSEVKNIKPGAPFTISVTRSSDNNTSCGSYQFDMAIYKIDGDSTCRWQSPSDTSQPAEGPGAAQVCQTGIDANTCQPPTATPTPTPTTAPTQTPTPTPAACPVPEAVKNVKVNCPNCSV